MSVAAAAQTISNQARLLGFAIEERVAATGTIYLWLSHPELEAERLIRISDHEPNEARYAAHVNEEPDMDVEPGYQAAAVERIAGWIGAQAGSVPYLRRAATLEARRRRERQEAEAARQAAFQAEEKARRAAYEAADDGDRAKADHYATLRGKARTRYGARHAAALRRAGARS